MSQEAFPQEERGDSHIEDFLGPEKKELADSAAEVESRLVELEPDDIDRPANGIVKEKVEAVRNFISDHPYLQDMYDGIKKFGKWPAVVTGAAAGLSGAGIFPIEGVIALLGVNIALPAYMGLKTGQDERRWEKTRTDFIRSEEQKIDEAYKNDDSGIDNEEN